MCEKDYKGNYILKWETYPEIDNASVEIFESDNDSVFPSTPTLVASSNDYIAIIKDSLQNRPLRHRKFFKVKIAGIVSDIISNRFFELDSVQNFRDIGGYITNDNRRVKWGKVFRSGSIRHMTTGDSLELNSLDIKTVIDLRSEDAKIQSIDRYHNVNYVRLPIAIDGYNSITKKVLEGKFLRDDAIMYMQSTYRDMVYNYTQQYTKLFDYLCNEKNYPVMLHCYLGKDQSGMAAYFLLKALDVPMDDIEMDYMGSAIGIDRTKLVKNADSLSESRQEAFTMLTKTDLAYLKYGISCIREKSGSIENYLVNELGLTPEKRNKLKKILLY
ncbi:tyrosine-protein phosphatase [Dysgonomonas sp. 511]|uniref:tyrosine-protein phosphatase n=1 Tax=Dysgonomonas sp. 511 TaxID=2302930 RepID=UPI002104155F|nr:tyrosine-protein phosphatase [Dysgonomonas sp. 511]